jgi:hypothetical protein
VLDFQKKKFRSTKFRVLFDNQREKLLKLKRSEKKGKVPFTFIDPVDEEHWGSESDELRAVLLPRADKGWADEKFREERHGREDGGVDGM